MKVPGGPDPEVGGTIRQVRCSSTGHFQMKSISIPSARAAPLLDPDGLTSQEIPTLNVPGPSFLLPKVVPDNPLPGNSPQARPQNRRARSQWCFVTQTCIRFIHKTAWFPKTIQTACSSAGSWPWARGPLGTTPTGRGPRREALSSVAIREARKKGLIFSKGSSQDQKYRDMSFPDLNG